MGEPISISKEITLVEVLDRILEKGVVISGDLIISVANVDLIYLGLRVLLCSVDTYDKARKGEKIILREGD